MKINRLKRIRKKDEEIKIKSDFDISLTLYSTTLSWSRAKKIVLGLLNASEYVNWLHM